MFRYAHLATMLVALCTWPTPVAATPLTAAHATGVPLLIVQTDDAHGESLLAFSPGGPRRRLPMGLLDHTGQTLYVAIAQGQHSTRIEALDPQTGHALRTLTLDGQFSTWVGHFPALFGIDTAHSGATAARRSSPIAPHGVSALRASGAPSVGHSVEMRAFGGGEGETLDAGQGLAALSFNDRWLALKDDGSSLGGLFRATHVTVIDTLAMRVAARLHLDGQFKLDAVGDDGRTLYLVRPLHPGSQRYEVRTYDLRHGRLDPRPLTDVDAPTGVMGGVAWTRTPSPDGAWLYTLYERADGGAYIHALGVANRTVHCIILPTRIGHPVESGHRALSVSTDGRMLYVADPPHGAVLAVHNPAAEGAVTTVGLTAPTGTARPPSSSIGPAAKGSRLFVATNSGIRALDTAAPQLEGRNYLPGEPVLSVAAGPGALLYALVAGHPDAHGAPGPSTLVTLDAPSGAVLARAPLGTAAWSIERVAAAS